MGKECENIVLWFCVGSVSDTLPEIDAYLATVTSTGSVSWFAPAVIMSSCPLDVTYFPWDRQVCPMNWGSWIMDKNKLNLFNQSSEGDRSGFLLNGEWDLIGLPVERQEESFHERGQSTIRLLYSVIIQRKALYYVSNLIMPCAFITTTVLLVFLLPPESGEKVSLAVTVLLATTVFLTMVSEIMPAQSTVVPLICKALHTR